MPKCVMVLTEGPSDRIALSDFFNDLYAKIDKDIEVFFPVLKEEVISSSDGIEYKYNGDITSRRGVDSNNIFGLLLKLFIQPELEKRPAYIYPKSVCEVIHLIDIDGIYLDNSRIIEDKSGVYQHLPYYDVEQGIIYADKKAEIEERNERKRNNIKKLVDTKSINLKITKESNSSRERPYRVFFFSSNLDHVLYGKANNEDNSKIRDAQRFSNYFYNEPEKAAEFFINHQGAVKNTNYKDSWKLLMENHDENLQLTNINILVEDLLNRIKNAPNSVS